MKTWDKFAPFYDFISPGLKGDLEFYLKEAKKVSGKVLEIACGTGRILLPLAKAGVDITGLDYSKGMLKVLKEKMNGLKKKPRIIYADMKSFKLKDTFDLIIIPYRSFVHMETQEDQIRALKNFYKHLNPKGRLILNLFVPVLEYIVKWEGKKLRVKDRDYINPRTGNKVKVWSRREYDTINQMNYWVNILEETKKGKIIRRTKIPGSLRYIFKNEFELLLRIAGFRKWKVYGGFKYQKLTPKSTEIIWIAEK